MHNPFDDNHDGKVSGSEFVEGIIGSAIGGIAVILVLIKLGLFAGVLLMMIVRVIGT